MSHATRRPSSGNTVYRRLRERGYDVFAVNPNTDEVEGDRSYHDLRSIPDGVDGVVIATRPDTPTRPMRSASTSGSSACGCTRAFGSGSVSAEATDYGRQHGVSVIDGGCPCMFEPTADPGRKVMRVFSTLTGKLPREV